IIGIGIIGTGFALNSEQTSNKDYIKENYENKTYKKGELIIKFKEKIGKTNDEIIKTNASKLKVKVKDKLSKENLALVEIDDNINIDKAISIYSKYSDIEYVQPNYIYELDEYVPNDPYFNLQWGLKNTGQVINTSTGTNGADIKWTNAMEIFSGANSGTGGIVAIIDDGVYGLHEDLINKMWNGENCKDENGNYLGGCEYGYDFYENDKNPSPGKEDTHGTHIAGIIGAESNNSIGLSGINPNVGIMGLRVGDDSMDRIKAINFAKHNGATVINASWSCYSKNQGGTHAVCGDPYSFNDIAMKEAIEGFPGLFITTAGNGNGDADVDGDNIDSPDATNGNDVNQPYPCAHNSDNIVCVTSTNNTDNIDYFANFGSLSVDLGAPGGMIGSTVQDFISSVDYYNVDFETYATGAYQPLFTSTNGNFGVINSFITGRDNVLITDQNRFPYLSNTNSFLESTGTNLSGTEQVILEAYVTCDTEYNSGANSDYFEIQFWDGSTFNTVFTGNEVTFDLDTNSSGYSYGFIAKGLENKYLINNFKYRINWITNSTDNNYGGCYFDDIRLYKNNYDHTYVYKSGTSMAAPHVSGLIALLQGYKPELTALQIKQAIMDYGDSLASLSGKTVSGKRINAYKTLAMFTNPSPTYITGEQTILGQTGSSLNGYFNANPIFSWDYPQSQGTFSGFIVTLNDFNGTVYSGAQTNNNLSGLNLTDGTYEIKVIGENDIKAGTETILNFNVDTTPPSIPTINITNLYNTGQVSVSWSGSIENGVGLNDYYYEIGDTVDFDGLVFSGYTSNTLYNFSGSDQTYYWRVKANDLLNNESGFSQVGTFIIDKTPPNAPTNIKINNNGIINLSNVNNTTIIGSGDIANNGGTWYANFEDINNLSIFLTGTINNGEIYKDGINFSILDDGIIDYDIFVQDLAGNIGLSTTGTIDKSTLSPVLSIEFNSGANYTNLLTGNLFIQSNKEGQYNIQGSGILNSITGSITNTKYELVQLTNGDGEKLFEINFEDNFNNTEYSSGSVILDQTNPIINISSHTNNQELTGTSANIQGVISDNIFISELTFNNENLTINKSNQYSGTFSNTLNLSGGNNSIGLKGKDAAGNETDFNFNLIRNPHNTLLQIINITDNTATIQFQSDLNTIGYLEYGTDSNNLNYIITGNTNTIHNLTLSNLLPNKTYYYRIKSSFSTFDSNYSQINSFTTLQENIGDLVYTGSANLTGEFNSNTG
ncbi:MAG: S8 family serine peptidase, partial [Candidatus Absconditabacteria bacterium]